MTSESGLMRSRCAVAVPAVLLISVAVCLPSRVWANQVSREFTREVVVGDVTIGMVHERGVEARMRNGILAGISSVTGSEVRLADHLVSLTVAGRPSVDPSASGSTWRSFLDSGTTGRGSESSASGREPLPWEDAEPLLARVLANHDSLDPVVPGGDLDAVGAIGRSMYLPRGLRRSARVASLGSFDAVMRSRRARRALFKEAALRAVALDEVRRFDENLDRALQSWPGAAAMLGAVDSVASAGLDTSSQLRVISDTQRAAQHLRSTAGIAGKVSSRVSQSGLGRAVNALGVVAFGVELAEGFMSERARARLLGEAAEDALLVLGLEDARRLLEATNRDPAMVDGLGDAITELTTMSRSRLREFERAAAGARASSVRTLVDMVAASMLSGGAALVLREVVGLAEELSEHAHGVMMVSALTTLGAVLRGPTEALIHDGRFERMLASDLAVRELVGFHGRLSAEATASVYNMLWTDRWGSTTNLADLGRGLGLTVAEWRTGTGNTEGEYRREVERRIGRLRDSAAFNARLPETLRKLRGLYTGPLDETRPEGSEPLDEIPPEGSEPLDEIRPEGPEPLDEIRAGASRVFDGMEFVLIPAGEFRMGSTSSEADDDERPVTRVRISRGFWLGKYEVTQAQWESVTGSNPSLFSDCGGNCPVEMVSWEEVQGFIGRLNARAGREVYRLPTEAEWEYAARAGTTGDRYGSLEAIAWWRENSGDRTHPAGGKSANGWGLHDMLGNVCELVQDWYGEYPGGTTVTDPRGAESGSYRVDRGGSWVNGARVVRAPSRDYGRPGFHGNNLGFRLLRTTR